MKKILEQLRWDDLHKEDADYIQNQYPTDMLTTYVRHHINKKQGAILDIGIGNAISATYLLNNTKLNIFGIDCSETAIAKAERQLSAYSTLNKRITLKVGSFTQLPFEDSSMDYVFAQDCLYYGGSSVFITAINEILRVLKDNGAVRFSVKTNEDRYAQEIDQISGSDYKVNRNSWEDKLTLYCPNEIELQQQLKGFSDFSIGYLNYDYTGLSGKKSFYIVTAIK